MDNNMIDELNKYLNQDIDNPKYLYHGSNKRLDILEPRLAHDSENNKINITEAIFFFLHF